jgi:hypothetical protein
MNIILIVSVAFFVILTISLITMNYMKISDVKEDTSANLKTQAMNILMNSKDLKDLKKYINDEVDKNNDKIKLNKTRINVNSTKIQKMKEEMNKNKDKVDSKLSEYDSKILEQDEKILQNETNLSEFKEIVNTDLDSLFEKQNLFSSNLGDFNFGNYQAFVNDVGAFKYGEFVTLRSNVATLKDDLDTQKLNFVSLSNDLPMKFSSLKEFRVTESNQNKLMGEFNDFRMNIVPITYATISSHDTLRSEFDSLANDIPNKYVTKTSHDALKANYENVRDNVLPNYTTMLEFAAFKDDVDLKHGDLEQRIKLVEEEL